MKGTEVRGTAALDTYLARLDAALAPLPAAERRDILLETRSHVAERTRRDPAGSVEAVLAELGPPEAYARQFLPEPDVPRPVSPERPSAPPSDALRAIARLATGGWTRLPLLFVVALAYGVAGFSLLLALWKLVEPDATGIWVHQAGQRRSVQLMVSDPNRPGREVLGYWLVPIALGITAAIHLVMSALLRRLLRRDAPNA
jgi:hypothetical protein